MESWAAFPPVPSLQDRQRADGVVDDLYVRLRDRGELLILSGESHGDQVVPVREVLNECLRRWGRPAVLVADYHSRAELHGVMASMGMDPSMHVPASLGWQDSPWRVRHFRRAVLDGRVSPPRSLLMRASLSGAVTQRDTGGNEKLVKLRGGRGGRIRDDVAVTLMLAVSEGYKLAQRPQPAGSGWPWRSVSAPTTGRRRRGGPQDASCAMGAP